ncbi:DUF7281 domain-containing protein [Citrobacter koseri]|uniref:DUF7281 domain-containing protein n=1 Tax=Citrobacter koseri TaxID=545 RepID=UPI000D726D36|nr:hypothetical protein [Citrobacter koseri]PWY11266.1 hypothetical protein DL345_17390 [Citrobacter koseri]
MSRELIAALRKLRKSPERCLASSQLTENQRRALEHFSQTTVSVARQARGSGVIFEVILPDVVEQQWRQLVPVEPDNLDTRLPNRARNIASTRNSKGAEHRHNTTYLLLKAGAGPVSWHNGGNYLLNLRDSTDHLGAAVLAIHPGSTWCTSHSLWLVENQALFDQMDWLPSNEPCSVAYYSGQLPNSVIDWLSEYPRAPRIYFFPDYDGVGLLNYARIRAKLGSAVQMWLMPGWQKHLSEFGSDLLWQTTQREFRAMQNHVASGHFEMQVKQLIHAMQRTGKALEQEAVWL